MLSDETTEICEECVVPMHALPDEQTDQSLLKCVRCPFCFQTVNAILTDSFIKCPKCEVQVALVK